MTEKVICRFFDADASNSWAQDLAVHSVRDFVVALVCMTAIPNMLSVGANSLRVLKMRIVSLWVVVGD